MEREKLIELLDNLPGIAWVDGSEVHETPISGEKPKRNEVIDGDNAESLSYYIYECEYVNKTGSNRTIVTKHDWCDTVEYQLEKMGKKQNKIIKLVKDRITLPSVKKFVEYCRKVINEEFARDMDKYIKSQYKNASTVKLNNTIHVYYHRYFPPEKSELSPDIPEADKNELLNHLSDHIPGKNQYEVSRYSLDGFPSNLNDETDKTMKKISDDIFKLSDGRITLYDPENPEGIIKFIYSSLLSVICYKLCLFIAVFDNGGGKPYIYFKKSKPDNMVNMASAKAITEKIFPIA